MLTVGLYLWVAAMRLKKLGMSGWNLFWALVPLANLWLAWRLAACPEGYHKHHNLDTSGVWLTAIYGIGILLECYNLWSG